MELDIYDFDKTLIPYDSGTRFSLYCLLHYPYCFPLIIPIGIGLLLAMTGIITYQRFKKICFCYVRFIPLEQAVHRFWDKHEGDVNPWFFERRRPAVIISASPDFLLEDICRRIGAERLICSRHNRKTGALIGTNCAKAEKVTRFYSEYDRDSVRVIDVYSDSLRDDRYIFALAQGKCYQIVNRKKKEFSYSALED